MAKKIISLSIGLFISGICIFLAFQNVPFSELLRSVSRVNYLYIGLSILITMFSFVLRVIRWRILLDKKIAISPCFHIMMTGFMLNCIMPARAGEIARPVLVSKLGNVNFSEAVASVAVERLFDIVSLLFLFITIYSQIVIPETLSYNFGEYRLNKALLESFVSGVGKLFILIFIFISVIAIQKPRDFIITSINFMEKTIISIFSKPSNIHKYITICLTTIANILKSFINGFASGIRVINTSYLFFKIVFISFALWIIQGFSYFVVAKAMYGVELKLIEIFFVMLVICFFIAIPSAPGFWGVWEASGIFAMMVFGVNKTDAAGYNLINHVVQIFPVIIIGFFSAWWISLHKKQDDNKSIV